MFLAQDDALAVHRYAVDIPPFEFPAKALFCLGHWDILCDGLLADTGNAGVVAVAENDVRVLGSNVQVKHHSSSFLSRAP